MVRVMNEKKSKRRDWVKNAAIIFLAIMLILTFFSNTIMNYSLPEVAVQYVQSGSITSQVRGTGTVESDDPYEVKIQESRKISSVVVKEGQEVQKGDVLFTLEDTESEELKAARADLEAKQEALQDAQDGLNDAWDAYYTGMLVGEIREEDIQAANGNVSATVYRQQITDAQNAMKPLEEKKAELEQQIQDIDTQIALEGGLDSAADTRVPAAKQALENAQNSLTGTENALNNAQSNYDVKKAALDEAQKQVDVSPGDLANTQLEKAQKEFGDAEKALQDAKTARDNAQKARDDAQASYNSAVANQNARKGSQTAANLEVQKSYAEIELYNVQKQIDDAQKVLDDLLTLISHKHNLDTYQDAISDARKVVDKAEEEVVKAQEEVGKQEAKAIGATVKADISGTVSAIHIVAGNTSAPDMVLAELRPEGSGYTMSFSVTNDQAKTLTPGIQADLVNAWRYDNITVTLASIRPDTDNPSQQKKLVFNVTGNVAVGQSISVQVGDRSANYDMVVPNSAIREDSNGKFVLTITSKATPLSTRYTATRVDVDVVASDDTRSAITGGLYSYDYVITTSDIPVNAGQQVRLSGN